MPQQNGVVEQKQRHVLEVARAWRFHSNLLVSFWGECILTVAYLINRMPLSILNNRTPYEVLFGKAPNYDHLYIFGRSCYRHSNKPTIFVGCPYRQKGYRINDLESKVTYSSQDFHFFEDIYPYSQTKGNITNLQP